MPEQSRLIPLTRWNEFHAWPPQGGLRWLMFNRNRNGFADAFVKCGRRVLIKEKTFFDCIARRQDFEDMDYGQAAH
jgi:hypothetical protein